MVNNAPEAVTWEHVVMRYKTGIVLALAAATLLPAAALAADYDPPIYVDEAPEYVPVEVGSGWYLRGDVGYAFKRNYKNEAFAADDALIDNDLIGLGWVGPLDTFSASRSETPVTASIGVGYHLNDWLRADVTVGSLSNDKYSGTSHLVAGYLDPPLLVNSLNAGVFNMPDFGCLGSRTITTTTTAVDGAGNPVAAQSGTATHTDQDWRRDCIVNATAKQSAWNGLVNGYIDLGTYSGFTPYIGAGVGLLQTRTKVTVGAKCENSSATERSMAANALGGTTTVEQTVDFSCRAPTDGSDVASYNKTSYDFMYGLSAGVSYQLSKNTSVDLGYQYVSAPNVNYYTIADDGLHYNKGYDMHQIKVGLRYDLW